MVRMLFALARVIIGLIGAWWLIGGVAGVVMAGLDHAWGPTGASALFALFGFCLAYGAFIRFPWESGRSGEHSA